MKALSLIYLQMPKPVVKKDNEKNTGSLDIDGTRLIIFIRPFSDAH